MKLSALWILTSLMCFAGVAHADALDRLREAYAQGRYNQVLKDAPTLAAHALSDSERSDLLRMSEVSAILERHTTHGLLLADQALLAQKDLAEFKRRKLSKRAEILKKFSDPEKLSNSQELFGLAIKAFESGKKQLKGLPPYLDSEAYFLVSSAAALKLLALKPNPSQKSEALWILGSSLGIPFPGREKKYLTELLEEFPRSAHATDAQERLKQLVEEEQREDGRPATSDSR